MIELGGVYPDLVAAVAAQLQDRRTRSLLAHWSEMRDGKLVPGWSDLDLTRIPETAPVIWSWVYDGAANQFKGRLDGTEIRRFMGRPISNLTLAEYFAGWNYDDILARHLRVVNGPAIALGHGVVFCRGDQQGIGERLILPLAEDGRHVDGLIGATAYKMVTRHRSVCAKESCAGRYQAMLGSDATSYFPLAPSDVGQEGTGRPPARCCHAQP